jgi:hypothetical protein
MLILVLFSRIFGLIYSGCQKVARFPYRPINVILFSANLMRVDGYIGPTTEFSPEDFPALPGATQQQQMQMTAIGSSSSHQARTESQLVSQPFGAQPNSFYNASSADFFSSTNGTNENGKDSKLGISINTSTG